MRRNLVESDLLECVLGLGPNLFYNSPMEACVVICRAKKSVDRQGRILFIDAVHEVARERTLSFLNPENQQRILEAYEAFSDDRGFAKVATIAEIQEKDCSLSIPRYVRPIESRGTDDNESDLKSHWTTFDANGRGFWLHIDTLLDMIDAADPSEHQDA
jgi:type I restriction enzyme M protein